MSLQRSQTSGRHRVLSYACGEVRLAGGATLTRSALLMPETLVHWAASEVGALTTADVETWLALKPELVILSTGETQRFPEPALIARALAAGVGVEVMAQGAACRTYNLLLEDGRSVLLALILPAAGAAAQASPPMSGTNATPPSFSRE
jgi:uncharacterized protein